MFRTFLLTAAISLTALPVFAGTNTYGYGGSNPYQSHTDVDPGRTWSTQDSRNDPEPEPETNPYGGRYVDDQDEDDTYETQKTYRDPSGADIHTDGSGVSVPND